MLVHTLGTEPTVNFKGTLHFDALISCSVVRTISPNIIFEIKIVYLCSYFFSLNTWYNVITCTIKYFASCSQLLYSRFTDEVYCIRADLLAHENFFSII